MISHRMDGHQSYYCICIFGRYFSTTTAKYFEVCWIPRRYTVSSISKGKLNVSAFSDSINKFYLCVEKILILYKNCNFYILIVAEVFLVIFPPLSVSKFQLFVVMSLVIIKKNKQIFFYFFLFERSLLSFFLKSFIHFIFQYIFSFVWKY